MRTFGAGELTSKIRFDKADESIIKELILENPNIMIPFFVTICGFSERELERLYGIRNVYGLGEHAKRKAEELANAIKKYLKYPYHLETVIYKFYKNWEEHQKRHFRGRRAEELVGRILMEHGYDAGKTKVVCRGEEIEIDYAIPRARKKNRIKIHRVKEIDEKGVWITVHEERIPHSLNVGSAQRNRERLENAPTRTSFQP